LLSVLKKSGLTHLIAAPDRARTARERLKYAIREELRGKLSSDLSTGDRWNIEQRVIQVALLYGPATESKRPINRKKKGKA